MKTEKQSSYFLRTQSTILNGENNINIKINTFRDNKRQLNKNYLSAGNNRKKNRKYISKNNNTKIKKNSKKTYVGIDLEKVSGSTHIYHNRNKNRKNNINKIPINKSLNYYQFLTKKNKKKEEEKNINDIDNDKNTRIIYKSNNYSPFHQIISNIKDKNISNNYFPRNDNKFDNFLLANKTNRFNTNPTRAKNDKENTNENNNNQNIQLFSSYRKCTNEKLLLNNNNIKNNNINKPEHVNTFNNNFNINNIINNNYSKQNDSKFTFTNNNNQMNYNNKDLYLNENIKDNELFSRRIKLMNQIKNIANMNNQNIYNNNKENKEEENTKTNKDLNIKINKSYSSNNYNNIYINNNKNNNSIYTPLPYKSFLKSIFDQNSTNKYLNDFNKISSNISKKNKNNNTFDYNKTRAQKIISKGLFEFNEDENKLKKLLENIPRHNKEKNKSEIYFMNNLNENTKNNKKNVYDITMKNKNDNVTKNLLHQINYVMPPNKLIKSNDDK